MQAKDHFEHSNENDNSILYSIQKMDERMGYPIINEVEIWNIWRWKSDTKVSNEQQRSFLRKHISSIR